MRCRHQTSVVVKYGWACGFVVAPQGASRRTGTLSKDALRFLRTRLAALLQTTHT